MKNLQLSLFTFFFFFKRTIHGPAMMDMPHMGMVQDGTKCGQDKVCLHHACVHLPVIPELLCLSANVAHICSGHGVSDNFSMCVYVKSLKLCWLLLTMLSLDAKNTVLDKLLIQEMIGGTSEINRGHLSRMWSSVIELFSLPSRFLSFCKCSKYFMYSLMT